MSGIVSYAVNTVFGSDDTTGLISGTPVLLQFGITQPINFTLGNQALPSNFLEKLHLDDRRQRGCIFRGVRQHIRQHQRARQSEHGARRNDDTSGGGRRWNAV